MDFDIGNFILVHSSFRIKPHRNKVGSASVPTVFQDVTLVRIRRARRPALQFRAVSFSIKLAVFQASADTVKPETFNYLLKPMIITPAIIRIAPAIFCAGCFSLSQWIPKKAENKILTFLTATT